MNPVTILSRGQHTISRKQISPPALKVLYRLKSKGFMAFLVGGALRDLLRDCEPRDYDVVTNATIPEIRAVFRNSKTVGKRFPIVHTYFGSDLVEISSLKSEDEELDKYELVREDALRRDFTVNTLLYEIDGFKVVDPLNALDDLNAGRVVAVGDAETRFREDPIRILRALKLVVKHGFHLSPECEAAIRRNHTCTLDIGAGRKYEELTRVILSGNAEPLLSICQEYDLLRGMWAAGVSILAEKGADFFTDIAAKTPIHYSRGSYAKPSHTHLWLALFLESGMFKPTTHLRIVREQFDHFLAPMAMPFHGPIVEAALCLGGLMEDFSVETPAGKEVLKLVEFYVTEFKPELGPKLAQLPADSSREWTKKKKFSPKGKRRRGYRGGRKRRGHQTKGT